MANDKRQFRAPDALWNESIRLDTELAELKGLQPNIAEYTRQALIDRNDHVRSEINRRRAMGQVTGR